MDYPIYTNILVPNDKGEERIVAALLDIHPNNIQRVLNQSDGFALVTFKDGMMMKLAIEFRTLKSILRSLTNIDERFAEEVDSYLNNNFSNYLTKKTDDEEPEY